MAQVVVIGTVVPEPWLLGGELSGRAVVFRGFGAACQSRGPMLSRIVNSIPRTSEAVVATGGLDMGDGHLHFSGEAPPW